MISFFCDYKNLDLFQDLYYKLHFYATLYCTLILLPPLRDLFHNLDGYPFWFISYFIWWVLYVLRSYIITDYWVIYYFLSKASADNLHFLYKFACYLATYLILWSDIHYFCIVICLVLIHEFLWNSFYKVIWHL